MAINLRSKKKFFHNKSVHDKFMEFPLAFFSHSAINVSQAGKFQNSVLIEIGSKGIYNFDYERISFQSVKNISFMEDLVVNAFSLKLAPFDSFCRVVIIISIGLASIDFAVGT